MDGLVGEPDPEFDDSATVVGEKGGVNGDEVINVNSSDDNGGDAGSGSGTDGVEAGAGGIDTGEL